MLAFWYTCVHYARHPCVFGQEYMGTHRRVFFSLCAAVGRDVLLTAASPEPGVCLASVFFCTLDQNTIFILNPFPFLLPNPFFWYFLENCVVGRSLPQLSLPCQRVSERLSVVLVHSHHVENKRGVWINPPKASKLTSELFLAAPLPKGTRVSLGEHPHLLASGPLGMVQSWSQGTCHQICPQGNFCRSCLILAQNLGLRLRPVLRSF
jgi:hypothetical protein